MENQTPKLEDLAIKEKKPDVCPSSLHDDFEDLELDVQPQKPLKP